MWKTRDYTGNKEVTYYEEHEYKEIEEKLAKCEEILYNIERHLKERHDWIAIQKIEEEVEKWKKNLNVKSVGIDTEMQ